MKKYYFAIIVSYLLSSCAIHGNFKGLYSYYKSTYKSNSQLFTHERIFNKDLDNKKIYVTNGKILKEFIADKPKAIVFMWSPLCRSQFCYRPEFLQQYFDNRNVELCIVSEYYDLNSMSKSYNLKNPIFGIDTKYYKSNLTDKYVNRFQMDLMNKTERMNRFLYFENGKYVSSFSVIDSFESIKSTDL